MHRWYFRNKVSVSCLGNQFFWTLIELVVSRAFMILTKFLSSSLKPLTFLCFRTVKKKFRRNFISFWLGERAEKTETCFFSAAADDRRRSPLATIIAMIAFVAMIAHCRCRTVRDDRKDFDTRLISIRDARIKFVNRVRCRSVFDALNRIRLGNWKLETANKKLNEEEHSLFCCALSAALFKQRTVMFAR